MVRTRQQPTNLELQALTVLWGRGPSTVAEVLVALPDERPRAYTTVLTVMQNLERKKLVRHLALGRRHVFEVACDRTAVTGGAVADFVTNVFGGRPGEAILAILSAGPLAPEEKTTIQQQLTKHRTMPAKKITKTVAKKTAVKKAAVATKAPAKKAAPVKKAAPANKVAVKKAVAAPKAPAKKVAAVKKAAPAKKAAVKKAAVKNVVAKSAKKPAPAKKVVTKKAVKKAAKKA